MPYPSKLPNNRDELLSLDRRHSRSEIAKMFGTSRQAVTLAMARHKIPNSDGRNGGVRQAYREEIPWVVAVEHGADYAVRMLRAYGAENRGVYLTPERKRALDEFKQKMDELDAVVAYERDRGFYLVPRQKGDVGYTRKPKQS